LSEAWSNRNGNTNEPGKELLSGVVVFPIPERVRREDNRSSIVVPGAINGSSSEAAHLDRTEDVKASGGRIMRAGERHPPVKRKEQPRKATVLEGCSDKSKQPPLTAPTTSKGKGTKKSAVVVWV